MIEIMKHDNNRIFKDNLRNQKECKDNTSNGGPIDNLMLAYLDSENKKLLKSYGPQVYEYSRELEYYTSLVKANEYKSFNLLQNHDINSSIRMKLIDWLFEVFYAYKSEESTIFLTIHLIDTFIYKYKHKLSKSDIHLIGVTSLFISSKAEDICPIDMDTLIRKISHNKFYIKEIKRKEKQILEIIDFNIFYTSPYDFIRNFIFDFQNNNKRIINKLKIKEKLELVEDTSIYLSKLILHSDAFSGYKSSLKAIACIITAFDMIRSNMNLFNKYAEEFINDWVNFIIDQSKFNPELINQVYNQINNFFNEFEKNSKIKHNLKKNACFDF